jgi:hypothetical protein
MSAKKSEFDRTLANIDQQIAELQHARQLLIDHRPEPRKRKAAKKSPPARPGLPVPDDDQVRRGRSRVWTENDPDLLPTPKPA